MRRTTALGFALVPLLTCALCAACAEHRVTGPLPSESTKGLRPGAAAFPGINAPAEPLLAASTGAPGRSLLPDGSPEAALAEGFTNDAARRSDRAWIDAVRLERWAEAASQIDALSEADRARPEIRYVRARTAIGAGDSARAVPLLDGLEQALPLIAADVARYRAEAQLIAGPYAEAAAYFEKSSKARDLTRAAEAYEKAGDGDRARRSADRAVAAAARAKSTRDEAQARMARARLARAKGGEAAAEPDLRWVAVHAPGSAEGRAATEALDRMKRPLSSKERLQAISDLVESGSADALVEIERMSKEPAAAKSASGELLHSRAMALYKARDYPEAARAFQAAAKAPGKSGHEAEDLFYAARSLARADRDEEAIKAYLSVAAKYKKSAYAERAQYLAARLYLQNGRFAEADKAYATYLTTYRKGEQRDDAAYERALAQLSSGAAASARKGLGELGRRAKGDEAQKLRELEGVAAFREGDRAAAVAIWTELARSQPLSWAAQASRARLAAAGATVPSLIEPAAPALPSGLDLKLPAAAALLASLGLDGDAESRLAASEREVAATYGGREGEALCGLYGLLSRAKRRYRVGINAVSLQALLRAPSEADRWSWDCLYPQPFSSGVRALEDQYSLPRGLVHALMRQESAFDPVIVSPASAVGLMQLMPGTAKQAASELSMRFEPAHLTSPDMNLRLGAFYINKLLKMFQGNVVLGAAAYNAGPRAVSHWLSVGVDNDLDLWVARIPYDETRNYVARVAQNLARYQWLLGGEAAVAPLSLSIPSDARAESDAY